MIIESGQLVKAGRIGNCASRDGSRCDRTQNIRGRCKAAVCYAPKFSSAANSFRKTLATLVSTGFTRSSADCLPLKRACSAVCRWL